MRLTNLLKETERVLKAHHLLASDVEFCSLGDVSFSWAEFEKMANSEYNPKTGANVVDPGLIVVGSGWWLERRLDKDIEYWTIMLSPRKQKWVDTAPQLFNNWRCIL